MRIRLFALWVLVASGGCIIDTVPLPEMVRDDSFGDYPGGASQAPLIDSNAIFWADEGAFVYLVAVPGGFPANAEVRVANPDRDDVYVDRAGADGSFAAAINARIDDWIWVGVVQDGVILDEVALVLAPGSVDAYEANDDLSAEFGDGAPGVVDVAVTRDAGSDEATVQGGPGSVAPGITVVVANARFGLAIRARAEADGSFLATVRAESGDTLLLFAVEPATSHGGGGAIEVTVP